MVDYEGEGETDLFSLQPLKRYSLYILNSLCVANYKCTINTLEGFL